MRKIEQDIINALRNQKNLHKGNTRVEHFQDIKTPGFETDIIGEVRLHGNLIAEFNKAANALTISDAGWTSNTTKSRLNALLSEFATGYGISQKNGEWRFHTPEGDIVEWEGAATFRAGNWIRD